MFNRCRYFLKYASIHFVYEKINHKGHSSPLHTRPLCHSLAVPYVASIATLLPDTGSDNKAKEMAENLDGLAL